MDKRIDKIHKVRNSLINLLSELTLEQINKIPAGFNNNIAWNLGHMIATQQGICYLRSGKKMHISEPFYDQYKKSSKPERNITLEEFEEIKKLFSETLNIFDTDLKHNLFTDFTAVITPYGVDLNNIDDAINFLAFHEGLHYGYSMALKRIVK